MRAAARVTSRRGHTWQVLPGPAVRDASRDDDGWRGPAARAGGDAGRGDQVAVAGELAVRAGEDPPGRPGDAAAAVRAGGGGAPLIDPPDGDPGLLGLVGQDGDHEARARVTGGPVGAR